MKEQNITVQLVVPKTKISTAVNLARHAFLTEHEIKRGAFNYGLTLGTTLCDDRFLIEKREFYIKVTHLEEEDYIRLNSVKDIEKSNLTFSDYI